MTSSFRASRRPVNPCVGWSYQSHFVVTAGFVLAVLVLMCLGGA